MHMLRYVGGKEGIDDGPRGVVRLLWSESRLISADLIVFCERKQAETSRIKPGQDKQTGPTETLQWTGITLIAQAYSL